MRQKSSSEIRDGSVSPAERGLAASQTPHAHIARTDARNRTARRERIKRDCSPAGNARPLGGSSTTIGADTTAAGPAGIVARWAGSSAGSAFPAISPLIRD